MIETRITSGPGIHTVLGNRIKSNTPPSTTTQPATRSRPNLLLTSSLVPRTPPSRPLFESLEDDGQKSNRGNFHTKTQPIRRKTTVALHRPWSYRSSPNTATCRTTKKNSAIGPNTPKILNGSLSQKDRLLGSTRPKKAGVKGSTKIVENKKSLSAWGLISQSSLYLSHRPNNPIVLNRIKIHVPVISVRAGPIVTLLVPDWLDTLY